jgi:hypothetical protein
MVLRSCNSLLQLQPFQSSSFELLYSSLFFGLSSYLFPVSSFHLQPGRVVCLAILANLIGDGLQQELLSAPTLNSILDMAVQSSLNFLDMLRTYRTFNVVTRTELKPSVYLVLRFSGLWIEDPHKIASEMLYMYTHE